jgi:hypothetical protein
MDGHPPTESGLQACYGKSPGNGAFSIGLFTTDSSRCRSGTSQAVSLEPLGAGAQGSARHRSARCRRGYQPRWRVSHSPRATLRRRGGRPPIGSAAASVESVRLDPKLREALARRARRDRETTSSVIRKALRKYLDVT